MPTRIRLEQCDCNTEIIIRTADHDEGNRLKISLEAFLAKDELSLTLAGKEYFIKTDDILFIQTDINGLSVHTADSVFESKLTLSALLDLLPKRFLRVSKSCIINMKNVFSIKRELTGGGEVEFYDTEKKAYVSRKYYGEFYRSIKEMRL